MPSRRTQRHARGNPTILGLLLLLVVGVLWYLNEHHRPNTGAEFAESAGPVERGPVKREETRGGFTRLDGCTLVEHRNNDGDSFHIRHGEQDYEFRLYYADCPEKRRHQYNGKRIAEQGRYFGGLDEEATVAVGASARETSKELLRGNRFAVFTKWEAVYDSGRYYAFVQLEGADSTRGWLHEILVSKGLARIHTKGIPLPSGTPYRAQKSRLAELETSARASKMGGWK